MDPHGAQRGVGVRAVVEILGVPIDDVTMEEAVERITGFVETGRETRRAAQVATVNVDFVVQATRNPALMDILHRTALSIPDGMPLVWGSRLLGTPLRERVAGADLVPALAQRGAAAGMRIYLFGAAPGVAEHAASLLAERFPGLDVTGDEGARVSPSGEMEPAALEPIVAFRPDIVCVALGNPKQEFWIERYAAAVGASVYIGVGGTLDLLVGEKRRAPGWVQRAGLEWVFRAAQEPRRLAGRYAKDLVVFLPKLARQVCTERRHRPPCG
jgi:N-acetylglucosaminyldiphosphoundecaprenol N-acetyl-beta-D-mannosaminyltransferase